MKLKNKKTGEIIEVESLDVDSPTEGIVGIPSFDRKGSYNSLAELNEEWCDYEEPEEFYIVEQRGTVGSRFRTGDEYEKKFKSIGNYFESREEAEKAVEKLKAWKRLKDKGFKVDLWDYDGGNYQERIKTGRTLFRVKDYEENDKDLDLLFGGEK